MNKIIETHTFSTGQQLQLVHGDLTEEVVDAIVNAANACLKHYGGVASVIVRRGGPEIQAESDLWVQMHGPVPHDNPAYTSSGGLPCKIVIHAVGPAWGEGEEDEKLAQAVSGALSLAEQLRLTSIALPPISTGIFGFPIERAARIFYSTISGFFQTHPDSNVKLVRLTVIDEATLKVLRQAFQEWEKDVR
jgi:O-acetyl-ADP-ribose deacetylase (regulator of RNase III)